MQKKNDLMTLLFFIVGLVAVVDLVFVQVRQKANEEQAQQRLECVSQVVREAQANMVYNTTRDNATRDWLLNPSAQNTEALKTVLVDRPNLLPECEINWN
jgi:Na+-translocating ferredoxin:NAD+ oxidoreductase RnfG subunit